MTALSAFTPRHGQDEAWVGAAEELRLDLDDAEARPPHLGARRARGSSWRRRRPGRRRPPSSAPCPRRPSSAGVPITWMRPANGKVAERGGERGAGARAGGGDHVVAAGVADDGSASYSAMIAMVGPGPEPAIVARNAVGSPPTPRSTWAPCLLEELGEPRRGLLFLEAELRIVVDLVATAPRGRRRCRSTASGDPAASGRARTRRSWLSLRANSSLSPLDPGRDRRADRRWSGPSSWRR